MDQIRHSGHECELKGIPIHFLNESDPNRETNDSRIVVLKGRSFFDRYRNLMNGRNVKNILEVGIFEGGSAVLFADMWPDAKIVSVDHRRENPAVLRQIEKLGMRKRIHLHYGISQDDEASISRIVKKHFTTDCIDLIIDDASHQYQLSRRTFEILFPYLGPGGFYVIEDWGWAHWRHYQIPPVWSGQPALSNLVMELVMTTASNYGLVEQVLINRQYAAVKKGMGSHEQLNLDDLFVTNGLSGTQIK